MTLKHLAAPALLSCAILCSAVQDGLSGKWTGSLRRADSAAYPLTYNFALIGDSVAGTAKSDLGEFPIDRGRLDSAGLHFTVTVNGLDVYHDGRVYADSIGMDITLNGSMVHCRLTKGGD
jgi:hypothetical protein